MTVKNQLITKLLVEQQARPKGLSPEQLTHKDKIYSFFDLNSNDSTEQARI